jgi:thiol-disulfide isomerase/thioredoxin
LVSGLLLAIVGCDGGTSPTASPANATAEKQPSNALAAEDISLAVVDGDGYRAELEKHRGKVVLVDFWATWCDPCLEKMPHIIQLGQQHADELQVVFFSTDEPSEGDAVRQKLAEQGANFPALLTQFGNGTKTNDTFGVHGVPQYKLYDRQGELRYQFAEGHGDLEHGEPLDNLDRRVAELLAESP